MSDSSEVRQSPDIANAPKKVETSSVIMAHPDHPDYTADRAVAFELAGGRSGLVAAIDGVGSGGEISGKAAEIVQDNLARIQTQVVTPPGLNQAAMLLKNEIFRSRNEILELRESFKGNADVDHTQIDTTVSAGIIAENADGTRKFLVTANVGDSCIYRYSPHKGTVDKLTTDHSLMQSLRDAGVLTEEETFDHPQRSAVYRCVSDLKTPRDIDIQVNEIQEGDIIISVSDGVSDNIREGSMREVFISEHQQAWDANNKRLDLKKLSHGIAQRARNIQTKTEAPQRKKDDICVAVLRNTSR